MNKIEKMFENVGVMQKTCLECDNNIDCNLGKGCCYPPFTGKKKIELIDWFIRNEDDVRIEFDCDDELYYFETVQDKVKTIGKSLAEALANLINIYFENFTDTEIEEVKEILR